MTTVDAGEIVKGAVGYSRAEPNYHQITAEAIVVARDTIRWRPGCTCGWTRNGLTRLPDTALRVGKNEHLPKAAKREPQPTPKSTSTCPTPGKQGFRSRATAEAELTRFWRTGRRKPLASRVYRCPCGKWHMTSKPQRDT